MIPIDQRFSPDPTAVKHSKLYQMLPAEHVAFLGECNGLYAYERVLHIFGVGSALAEAHDLDRWNSEQLWRSEYGDIANGLTFFAETVFGDQFGFTASGEVFEFLSETGHRNLVASSFSDWLMKIEFAPEETLDVDVVEDWMSANEIKIGAGSHLCPRIPFSLGGSIAKFEDAYLCPAVENMRFKAQLASQLRRLKPGDKVDLRAINLPLPIDTDGR